VAVAVQLTQEPDRVAPTENEPGRSSILVGSVTTSLNVTAVGLEEESVDLDHHRLDPRLVHDQ
jgi:hypothetical protein